MNRLRQAVKRVWTTIPRLDRLHDLPLDILYVGMDHRAIAVAQSVAKKKGHRFVNMPNAQRCLATIRLADVDVVLLDEAMLLDLDWAQIYASDQPELAAFNTLTKDLMQRDIPIVYIERFDLGGDWPSPIDRTKIWATFGPGELWRTIHQAMRIKYSTATPDPKGD